MEFTRIFVDVVTLLTVVLATFQVITNFTRKTKTKVSILQIELDTIDSCFLIYFLFFLHSFLDIVFAFFIFIRILFVTLTNLQVARFNRDILRVIRARNQRSFNFVSEIVLFLVSLNFLLFRTILAKSHFSNSSFILSSREDLFIFSIASLLVVGSALYAIKCIRVARVNKKCLPYLVLKTANFVGYLIFLIIFSTYLEYEPHSYDSDLSKVASIVFFCSTFLEKLLNFLEMRSSDYLKYSEYARVLRLIYFVSRPEPDSSQLLDDSIKMPLIFENYDFDNESEVISFLNKYVVSLSCSLRAVLSEMPEELSELNRKMSAISHDLDASASLTRHCQKGRKRFFHCNESGVYEVSQTFILLKEMETKLMLQPIFLEHFSETDAQSFLKCAEDLSSEWSEHLIEGKGIFSYLGDDYLQNKRNMTFRSKSRKYLIEVCSWAVLKSTFINDYCKRKDSETFLPRIVAVFKSQFINNEAHVVIVTDNLVSEELINHQFNIWQHAILNDKLDVKVVATSAPSDFMLSSEEVVITEDFKVRLVSYNSFKNIITSDVDFLRKHRVSTMLFTFLYCEIGLTKNREGMTFVGDSFGDFKETEDLRQSLFKNISKIESMDGEPTFSSRSLNELIDNSTNFEAFNKDKRCIISFGFDNVMADRLLVNNEAYYRQFAERILVMFVDLNSH